MVVIWLFLSMSVFGQRVLMGPIPRPMDRTDRSAAENAAVVRMISNLTVRATVGVSGAWADEGWFQPFNITNNSGVNIKDVRILYVCLAESGTVLRTNIAQYMVPVPAHDVRRCLYFLDNIPSQTKAVLPIVCDFEIENFKEPAPVPPIPTASELERARADAAARHAASLVRNFQLIKKAAESGDAYGQRRLGEMYRDGEGTGRDLGQARAWLARAAAQGDAEASGDLAALAGR
jgi:hypothetical protein